MTQIASQEDVDKILKAFYLVYNTLGSVSYTHLTLPTKA